MPPNSRHPHDAPGEHHRPEWWNGISLGNAITLASMLVAAAVAWGANTQKQDEQDKRIADAETRIAVLIEKVERMAITQAAISANVETLVRAQGLQPVRSAPAAGYPDLSQAVRPLP